MKCRLKTHYCMLTKYKKKCRVLKWEINDIWKLTLKKSVISIYRYLCFFYSLVRVFQTFSRQFRFMFTTIFSPRFLNRFSSFLFSSKEWYLNLKFSWSVHPNYLIKYSRKQEKCRGDLFLRPAESLLIFLVGFNLDGDCIFLLLPLLNLAILMKLAKWATISERSV